MRLAIVTALLIAIGGHTLAAPRVIRDYGSFTSNEQDWLDRVVLRAEESWSSVAHTTSLVTTGTTAKNRGLRRLNRALLAGGMTGLPTPVAAITTFTVTRDPTLDDEVTTIVADAVTVNGFTSSQRDWLDQVVKQAEIAWSDLANYNARVGSKGSNRTRAFRRLSRALVASGRPAMPGPFRTIDVFTVTRDQTSNLVTAIHVERP